MSLGGEWLEWCGMFEPDPERIAAEERAAREWARDKANQPGFDWRFAHLLAEIAASRGDRPAAYARIDEAIAAYPARDYPNPMVQSKIQHLVNRRAEWLLADEGIEEAVACAAKLLATDRRFHYFFVVPWSEWLDAAQRETLVSRIERAYGERAKRFPELADQARVYAAKLSER